MTRSTRSSLSCASVTADSRSVDWRDALDENGEGWRAADVVTCSDCGRRHVVTMPGGIGGEECGDVVRNNPDDYGIDEYSPRYDKAIECDATIDDFDGPMMSAFWPCEHRLSLEDAARALDKFGAGSVCAVEFESGETGFALTGGGMDLSGHIAAAYVAVGHLPPASLRLEAHMFLEPTARARKILRACAKSGKVAANWALTASRRNTATLREVEAKAASRAAVAALAATFGPAAEFKIGGQPVTGTYRHKAPAVAAEALALAGRSPRDFEARGAGAVSALVDVEVSTPEGWAIITTWTADAGALLLKIKPTRGPAEWSAPATAEALRATLAKLRRAIAAHARASR
jgi:hypothetical protein